MTTYTVQGYKLKNDGPCLLQPMEVKAENAKKAKAEAMRLYLLLDSDVIAVACNQKEPGLL